MVTHEELIGLWGDDGVCRPTSDQLEATNMPHAGRYGVRLVGEVGVYCGGGVTVAVRGGYQARKSTDGAPSGGAQLSFAF